MGFTKSCLVDKLKTTNACQAKEVYDEFFRAKDDDRVSSLVQDFVRGA